MTIRILGLGNDLLADDAFGVEVVRHLAARLPAAIETRASIAAGFGLLDDIVGVDRLIVVDTVAGTGAEAGTVHRLDAGEVISADGGAPHYVGLFETLRLARALALHTPRDVVIFAVEADDCLTIGGPMTAPVKGALPEVVRLIEAQVACWEQA